MRTSPNLCIESPNEERWLEEWRSMYEHKKFKWACMSYLNHIKGWVWLGAREEEHQNWNLVGECQTPYPSPLLHTDIMSLRVNQRHPFWIKALEIHLAHALDLRVYVQNWNIDPIWIRSAMHMYLLFFVFFGYKLKQVQLQMNWR
jgi:hypothetical protein